MMDLRSDTDRPVRSTIGIRAEDKNRWERRVPLTPEHVSELVREHDVTVRVQPSARRAFSDMDYERSGADLALDLDPCQVILGVKEIPIARLLPEKTYVYFSHVIKGQAYNMPMLRRLMELRCTLIDYEPIVDERGRRLIFFGRHAGYAGMIDTLWALGQRLAHEGFVTPFAEIRLAHQYSTLDEALRHISAVGERIRRDSLPVGLRPVVFAFTGSGNVALGAQEVFSRLPFVNISVPELAKLPEDRDRPRNVLYKTVLGREDRCERIDGGAFDEAEFAAHPERYRSALDPLLPHITVFVNGIYWDPRQPRLITSEHLQNLWESGSQPKLRVIGDITCDVAGSVEATTYATEPGDPVYVYDPFSGATAPGVAGSGPVVMAVDNLPCELPIEASQHFGDSLLHFVPALSRCDWNVPFEDLELPEELKRAIIVHRGALTPGYSYLQPLAETAE